jgi:vanillate O-demethylase monooxygenase subunit
MFRDYYARGRGILETMQGVLSLAGPRPDVHVAADAAAVQVRKIVNRMVADEQLGGTR